MNKIVEIATRFKQQKSDSDHQALSSQLEYLREQFGAREQQLNEMLEQNPDAQAHCSVEIDGYFGALQELEVNLVALTTSFQEKRFEQVVQLAERAAELEYEVMVAWDQARTTIENLGHATTLPPINEIVAMAEDVAAGVIPASFLGAAARREERKIELLFPTLSERLVSAFKVLQSALKNLADQVDEFDVFEEEVPDLEELIRPILLAAEVVVSEQSRSNLEERAEGPTQFPDLNLLLHLVELYWLEQISLDEVLPMVDTVLEVLSRLEEGSSEMHAALSGTVKEECGRLNEVVQDMESHLMDLEETLLDSEAEEGEVKTLKHQLEELAAELTEIQSAIQALSEMEGKVPCVSCSAYNSSERRHCSECGAILPANAMEKVTQLEFVAGQAGVEDAKSARKATSGENFRRLFQALDRALSGQDAGRLIQREVHKLDKAVSELLDNSPAQSSTQEKELFEAHASQLAEFQRVLGLTNQAAAEADLDRLEECRDQLWSHLEVLQELKSKLERLTEDAHVVNKL